MGTIEIKIDKKSAIARSEAITTSVMLFYMRQKQVSLSDSEEKQLQETIAQWLEKYNFSIRN